MPTHRFINRLAVLLLCLCSLHAAAQDEPEITPLSFIDQEYMQRQREAINALVATHFGRQFNGQKDNDIELLQRLLDDRIVHNDQVEQLQAMGIILGDLLASDLDMHWVVYTDKVGRSRALRYRDTGNYLFPVTMIARRREADNRTPVAAIYDKAEAAILAVVPRSPYD